MDAGQWRAVGKRLNLLREDGGTSPASPPRAFTEMPSSKQTSGEDTCSNPVQIHSGGGERPHPESSWCSSARLGQVRSGWSCCSISPTSSPGVQGRWPAGEYGLLRQGIFPASLKTRGELTKQQEHPSSSQRTPAPTAPPDPPPPARGVQPPGLGALRGAGVLAEPRDAAESARPIIAPCGGPPPSPWRWASSPPPPAGRRST